VNTVDDKKEVISALFREVFHKIEKMEKEQNQLKKKIDGLIEEKRATSERIEKMYRKEDDTHIKWLLNELESSK
jgi:uncharacterized coiled-coil DUF342 family protein